MIYFFERMNYLLMELMKTAPLNKTSQKFLSTSLVSRLNSKSSNSMMILKIRKINKKRKKVNHSNIVQQEILLKSFGKHQMQTLIRLSVKSENFNLLIKLSIPYKEQNFMQWI